MFFDKGYMTDDVIGIGASTIVFLSSISEHDKDGLSTELARSYSSSYKDTESEIKDSFYECSKFLDEFIRDEFPNCEDSTVSGAARQFQYLFKYYHIDGRKKRKKILNGSRFNNLKDKPDSRVSTFKMQVMVYHLGTLKGVFPLCPDDWSLS